MDAALVLALRLDPWPDKLRRNGKLRNPGHSVRRRPISMPRLLVLLWCSSSVRTVRIIGPGTSQPAGSCSNRSSLPPKGATTSGCGLFDWHSTASTSTEIGRTTVRDCSLLSVRNGNCYRSRQGSQSGNSAPRRGILAPRESAAKICRPQ